MRSLDLLSRSPLSHQLNFTRTELRPQCIDLILVEILNIVIILLRVVTERVRKLLLHQMNALEKPICDHIGMRLRTGLRDVFQDSDLAYEELEHFFGYILACFHGPAQRD